MIADIKNYEGLYTIDFNGNVFRNGRKLIAGKYPNGYLYIRLTKNGKRKNALLHRLIANAFIPKVNGKNFVNHINGIKTDNRIENLEWCTHSENCIHAINNNLNNCRKKVIDENGNIYNSVKEAAESIGIKPNTLTLQLIGRINNKTKLKLYVNNNQR